MSTLALPGPGLNRVGELCELPDPYVYPANYDELFLHAMRENTLWHFRRNERYKKILLAREWTEERIQSFERLDQLPYIPADFFKRYELTTVSPDSVFLHLTSSGTTGQKSQMYFDQWSIQSAQRMLDWIFEKNRWVDTRPTNYLLFTYESTASTELGTAYTDNYLCKYAPVHAVEFALKRKGASGHEFDPFGCLRALQEFAREGKPVRIFGFPAFFYFVLERMQALGVKPLQLHPDSLVFLGGGWKGHADRAIAKPAFYDLAETLLGIPNERLRDGYGSVEHCIPYVECAAHSFHVPVWSQAIIRDVKTLAPQAFGDPGFLQFISPYITSVPAQSVLMGDYAELYPGSACACDLPTPWFKVLGRAGISQNKSCAVAAAELLGEAR